jgi:hypothetical protein
MSCNFNDFKNLAREVSFYGNSSGYNKLCQRNSSVFDPPRPKEIQVDSFVSHTIESEELGIWTKVLLCYLGFMLAAGLFYILDYLSTKETDAKSKLIAENSGPSTDVER